MGMKVLVFWENPNEQRIALNLVAVIKKIGTMLVYGKVQDDGVLFNTFPGTPNYPMEVVAVDGVSPIKYATPQPGPGFPVILETRDRSGTFTKGQPKYGGVYTTSREEARLAVAMFPKPVAPEPDTNSTGVTIRQLDLDEEHES